ncbi:MAG: bifunctional 4-hydroxy-2-oxoglutarate aldolase/2-dehydro-3-deoxy-phosphogluconate aldolase [Rhodobacterales bacterium]|nr:bifunctional 4-hydroxy-2-oxoglutarate aldolase/2-dehydro-3-deoxy-phosphogluconate aldolase [Rhodobacterales bacterium]MDX5392129.1 bifunctional 4-hydroxy-2-oxoglutarate aldolase/2-dehydro-3-deoxy-phosphogluconate aldolase [Rhodobacterales bacterium]MDX5491820.1 bifunctional 4-hydroxy-2-oxoglutarate aldolase/2-dehydro-3-deoxy-phosphogluconate aldolase [Rhodobacterales bacterium]
MTPHHASEATLALCQMAPVIPVLVVHDAAHARPLAQALVAGGLPVLEVTLRTPAALEVMTEMGHVAGAVVGAGTVLSPADVRAVKAAGAGFAVSPGATDRLLAACEDSALPLLPGAATATEAMALLERGYTTQKFFPAEVAGGAAALRALSSPLPQITFCPTGGIGPGNVADYLGLPNVVCVGGSWVAPAAMIASGDWDGITALARAAATLPRTT